MISIVYNETLKGIEVYLDAKGADLLIRTLQNLKSKGDHLHLRATNDDLGVSTRSPYRESQVFGELILTILPSEAWEDAGIIVRNHSP
ncbi:hypothetical protein [Bradyrhizobium roseum]|jgi:hypothetical protein|uniref:hypothetical protein n=1 Tax=Bradyrhizobium roseum TaxID=3056648 RepID=UPI002607679B|nr:hypothetical protein [Bradyrhizobium roseus]WKA28382.1 hypothetical protein QUH67_33430 [Bradyrhizobium roseus]